MLVISSQRTLYSVINIIQSSKWKAIWHGITDRTYVDILITCISCVYHNNIVNSKIRLILFEQIFAVDRRNIIVFILFCEFYHTFLHVKILLCCLVMNYCGLLLAILERVLSLSLRKELSKGFSLRIFQFNKLCQSSVSRHGNARPGNDSFSKIVPPQLLNLGYTVFFSKVTNKIIITCSRNNCHIAWILHPIRSGLHGSRENILCIRYCNRRTRCIRNWQFISDFLTRRNIRFYNFASIRIHNFLVNFQRLHLNCCIGLFPIFFCSICELKLARTSTCYLAQINLRLICKSIHSTFFKAINSPE